MRWASLVSMLTVGGIVSIALAGCARDVGPTAEELKARWEAQNVYPEGYRSDLLAFMRTYLNDPVGVRGASLAEPVQRSVGGNMRYVACVRYAAKDFNGRYAPVQERGIAFVDGRLDRVIDNSAEVCAGASYQPFPEMEKMTR